MSDEIVKPTVISKNQLTLERRAMALWQVRALRHGDLRSCVNCDHFNEPDEVCALCAARPPAKVIVLGCDSWTEEIPF